MAVTDDAVHSNRRPAEDIDREVRMLVDGEWVLGESGETFSCVDPYTEEPWGRVPIAGAADVDRAVRAARRAFDADGWPQTSAAERAGLLRRLAQLIEENAETLTYRQIRENGKLVSEMRPGANALAADCHFFAGLGEALHGMSVPVSAPNFVGYTMREPIGVVAAITPWNTPLGLLGWKLFPALAAGNTVVVKPSEVTPTSTLLLAELIVEAGFPAGVVNVVTGYGDPTGMSARQPSRRRQDRLHRLDVYGQGNRACCGGAQCPRLARARRQVAERRLRRRGSRQRGQRHHGGGLRRHRPDRASPARAC